ncbi:ABC transporter substrate-binding protein [Halosegnis marinus]|uniref:ABC transporter substrate-binding protein n=1 Tax=Halosegnis marinus TaxID=3034023 RepID=A0ABD5ZND1_9EURY|nr:ABC transporter substrate-binding protein [Halosegnis sp. DT85]
MSHDSGGHGFDRRDILKGLGVGGVAGLAGCTNNSSTPTATDDDGEGDATATETATETAESLGDTLVGPDGNQVELTHVYSTGSQTTETTAEFIGQKLGEVGINTNLTGLGFNQMLAQYAQNGGSFNGGPRDESTSAEPWDLMTGIGFNAYPRTPSSINVFWSDVDSDIATVNYYGYKPSEPVEPKLSEASQTADEATRRELFGEVFGIISEDQPADFLTLSTYLNGFRDRVNGLGEPDLSFGWNYQTRYFGDSPSVGGTYVSGTSAPARTLNPIRSNDAESDARIGLPLDGAYTLVGGESEFQGLWFESYEQNEDATAFEFTLRDNLQWGADYGQMTADDWVYYIRNVRQSDVNWAGDVNHSTFFQNGEPMGVEQVDELTFRITLNQPDPAFIQKPILWGAYCLPRGLVEPYYERVQDASNEEEQIAIGNELNEDEEILTMAYAGNLGPYSYERWDRDAVFVASRNEDYYAANTVADWGDVPYFEEYRIQVFSEQSTRISAFQAGEIDATGIPQAQYETLSNTDGINVVLSPNPFLGLMPYNQRANGWDQLRTKEVRQAISTAIPKQVIAEQINRGLATPAYTHQPEYSRWYVADQVVRFGGPDSNGVGQAQRLLADNLADGYSFE